MLPILLKTDSIVIYSYSFMMGVAWAFAYRLSSYYLEKYTSEKKMLTFFIGLFLSSFLGAKLFFLAFSAGNYFDAYTESLSFWFGGGFVFYGGLAGGGVWSYLSCFHLGLISKENTKFLLPGLAFGHAIGRVGCFLAGCCYGHLMENGEHFPIQLIEAAFLSGLGWYLCKHLHKKTLILDYLISYSVIRFIVEFERSDEIRGVLSLRISTSQLISMIILFSVLLIKFKPPRKTNSGV